MKIIYARSGCEFGIAEIAHNLANQEGPPPLAVVPMLGLTWAPGQANADHGTYDFSLENLLIVPIFQAFEGHPPETVNL